ncbi:MAG: hypothetical protein AB1696_24485 [Planctomycetota bacterium]
MNKALVMLSGGLDSILALRLMLDQNVEIEAIHFVSFFCSNSLNGHPRMSAVRATRRFGVPLNIANFSRDMVEIVRDPPHGYGKNANPCIDCRIASVKRAAEYMKKIGASFLVTGEVLGERPMSQRREPMRLIDRESGMEGRTLRPLSAKLLDPTIPEQEGIVDREKLCAIQGRSRLPQMEMAKRFGIEDYPSPAGGCLLTDPSFGKKMLDLIAHKPNYDGNDAHLLKMGRHFRLSPETKVIVGRDEKDNWKIVTFAKPDDVLFEAAGVTGPTSLLRGPMDETAKETAAALTARYGKARHEASVKVHCWTKAGERIETIVVAPMQDDEIEKLRIG